MQWRRWSPAPGSTPPISASSLPPATFLRQGTVCIWLVPGLIASAALVPVAYFPHLFPSHKSSTTVTSLNIFFAGLSSADTLLTMRFEKEELEYSRNCPSQKNVISCDANALKVKKWAVWPKTPKDHKSGIKRMTWDGPKGTVPRELLHFYPWFLRFSSFSLLDNFIWEYSILLVSHRCQLVITVCCASRLTRTPGRTCFSGDSDTLEPHQRL